MRTLAAANLSCDVDAYYTVQQSGGLYEGTVGSTGTTRVGSFNDAGLSGTVSMNGLGISRGGSYAIAFDRYGTSSSSYIQLVKYTASTNTFAKLGSPYRLTEGPVWNQMIAGAINPVDGQYYFGGYDGNSQRFYLYRADPGSGTVTYLGYVLPNGVTGSGNGDIAFDSNGNLFLIYSTTSANQIVPVTAQNLQAADGQQITAEQTQPRVASPSGLQYNGISFLPSGQIVVQAADVSGGNANTIVSTVDPNLWTRTNDEVIFRTMATVATDLATCTYPPTLAVQKNVMGRYQAGDQFQMSIVRDGQSSPLAAKTTAGSQTGIQAQIAGPAIASAGAKYDITETASGTTDLSHYTTTYACTSDTDPTWRVSGSGSSFSIDPFPSPPPSNANGPDVTCTFTNTPVFPTASVTVSKQVTQLGGTNPQPASGWTMGATLSSPPSGVTITTPSTQVTGQNGSVPGPWTISGFSSLEQTTTLAVSETQQPGYQFLSGSCVVTHSDKTTTTTTLTSENGTVPGVKSGDSAACTFVNKPVSASLTLVKRVSNTHGGTAQPTDWTLTATGPTPISGVTGSTAVSNATVKPGTYSLSEGAGPAGYQASAWTCTGPGATQSAGTVTLAQGAQATCTITNSDEPGSVSWAKNDESGHPLAGSEWTLTPTGGTGGAAITVVDNGTNDADPTAGALRLVGLSWGSYSLVESKAPLGYVLDTTPHQFTVGPGNGQIGVPGPTSLGTFANKKAAVPALPLTGGSSADLYFFLGGGLGGLALLGGWLHRRRSIARR
ncbi:LPXTG-motif cell wall anchor domain-containing protein [Propionibacterium cyclohexanicum]|uniref:LPXTG-motif cell wall anchor domain-containing protein n=1 Tax=Propionibacterium cyclohexanicum TaxID=64702 RepID=A0A1H9RR38_9ACTN|nr:SpaA isopeptide-forming pilin-related protein [Propionibacterium cyclohexanicum]SER74925.1 LPXTG-motif cell wall anchor domain-containing protein [Propionibacterium cyclohexanicum]